MCVCLCPSNIYVSSLYFNLRTSTSHARFINKKIFELLLECSLDADSQNTNDSSNLIFSTDTAISILFTPHFLSLYLRIYIYASALEKRNKII